MDPGVYRELPNDTYQASPGLSVSRLKRFAEAPAKALVKREPTRALALGSLIHTACLEPAELERRYCVTQLKRISDREKATQLELERAAGRELIKQADFDEARYIADAFMAHPVARELIVPDKIEVETSAYWTDPETGLPCRMRADVLRPDWRVIADVKSTQDASPADFAKTCATYSYHWQESFYRTGLPLAGGFEPEAFVFFAIEKEDPYLVGAYEIDPHDVRKGGEEIADHMLRYAECVRTGVWPGYSQAVERLTLPHWAHAA